MRKAPALQRGYFPRHDPAFGLTCRLSPLLGSPAFFYTKHLDWFHGMAQNREGNRDASTEGTAGRRGVELGGGPTLRCAASPGLWSRLEFRAPCKTR